ncbi:MAG: type VI secretion system tip protein TssI/VgrG [Gemmataceae bacterium]
MSTTQKNQPLALVTPAWKETLLMSGLSGQEGLSQLFQFEFEILVENEKLKSPLPFHKVIGEPLSARFLQGGKDGNPLETRYFSGICAEFNQGATDEFFTAFRAIVVPKLWLLTRHARSRIFQQITVPQILEKVLKELLGGAGELKFQLEGKYEPRDYCVQYRETDFNFVSRLMEEEGIFYFFKHTENAHELIVTDTPKSHPGLRTATLITGTESGLSAKAGTAVITSWLKRQELRTGKVTLWDHTFELPHKNLQAESKSQSSVTAGKAPHELAVKANSSLELYDWPGEYAQRFDGVPPGGGERPDIQKVFQDNERTTKLRMQQQASGAVSIFGGGTWAQLVAGAKMGIKTVEGDHRAKYASAEGEYVLTSVTHFVAPGNPYRTGGSAPASYQNHFVAVPADLPFRPARVSPKPVVHGTQSAQVVGPPGEEIFTDKYGRIKVQFHWDREGKRNAESSCWIRVGMLWAGRNWGHIHIPRIGQEVLVDFLEGDPDQPIVVGNTYNPDQMPSDKLPDHKTRSHIKSNSTPGGDGYNAIRFEDKAGQEQVYIHAQRNMDERVRNDSMERVGVNRHLRVGFHLPKDHQGDLSGETKKGNQYEEIAIDKHLKVHRDHFEHIGGSMQLLIGGGDGKGNLDIHVKNDQKELIDGNYDMHTKKNVHEQIGENLDFHVQGQTKELYDKNVDIHVKAERKELVDGNENIHVKGDHKEKVDGTVSLTIGKDYQEKAGMKHCVDAGMEIHLKAGMKVIIEAMQVSLKGAGGFIDIGPAGVAIQGTMVLINSGGSAGSGSGASPQAPTDAQDAENPKDPEDAKPIKPKDADYWVTGKKSN